MAEVFKLFISANRVNEIVNFTNQWGAYETENRNDRVDDMIWKDVYDTEVYAFIGLLVCAGALKAKREPIWMLWQDDPCFHHPIFSAIMPQGRFLQISSWMRFDDKDTRLTRRAMDKLAPIWNVSELFIKNCLMYWNSGSHLTVDEQLVPFYSRCPFRVYMKSKPAKYGIKIWILPDAETSYCKNLQIYLGKEGNVPEWNQGKRVVLDLVSCLGPGYVDTTDNFFTSLELPEELLDRNTIEE